MKEEGRQTETRIEKDGGFIFPHYRVAERPLEASGGSSFFVGVIVVLTIGFVFPLFLWPAMVIAAILLILGLAAR